MPPQLDTWQQKKQKEIKKKTKIGTKKKDKRGEGGDHHPPLCWGMVCPPPFVFIFGFFILFSFWVFFFLSCVGVTSVHMECHGEYFIGFDVVLHLHVTIPVKTLTQVYIVRNLITEHTSQSDLYQFWTLGSVDKRFNPKTSYSIFPKLESNV